MFKKAYSIHFEIIYEVNFACSAILHLHFAHFVFVLIFCAATNFSAH